MGRVEQRQTVKTHKAYRFRIYPTSAQERRLCEWQSTLRWLWNLANEQRCMGVARPKGERRYPTAFDQINELTALRAELPWLADVPRNVSAQLLIELDRAWQCCFKKLQSRPRWKRKAVDRPSLKETHHKLWRLDGDSLHFPKIGRLRTVAHRAMTGKPKTCSILSDGDQWFASI
ncbi:hypothetical protein EHM76_05080, partial [bacterium]